MALEQRVRSATVVAALATTQQPIMDNVSFGKPTYNFSHGLRQYDLEVMGESEVNSIFEDPSLASTLKLKFNLGKDVTVTYSCWGMASIDMARGLIEAALKPGEFDALGLHPWDFGDVGDLRYQPTGMSLAEVPTGYMVNFKNDTRYPDYKPNGMMANEFTIKVSSDEFVGWKLGPSDPVDHAGPRTQSELIQELVYYFNVNTGLSWWKWTSAENIPGYTGKPWFIDIPKVAQKLFNYRTGQSN
jgi:hypothetical protein